jgi:hypothetical protein
MRIIIIIGHKSYVNSVFGKCRSNVLTETKIMSLRVKHCKAQLAGREDDAFMDCGVRHQRGQERMRNCGYMQSFVSLLLHDGLRELEEGEALFGLGRVESEQNKIK